MAGGIETIGADPRLIAEIIASRLDRHDDFFERRIAGPLADSIDRALNLACAPFDRRQTIGDAQSQIVVAMSAEDRLADIGHVFSQVLEDVPILSRDRVSHRIRNIDRRRAGLNGPLDNLAEEIELRSRRVFRRKFDVRTVIHRSFHHFDRLTDDLFLRHFQLVLPVNGTCREEHVDSRFFGPFQCRPGAIDVLFETPRQCTYHRPISKLAGDFAHGLKVPG
jgi:hypothetical protein